MIANSSEYEINKLRQEIAWLREMVANRDMLISDLNLEIVYLKAQQNG